MKMAEKL